MSGRFRRWLRKAGVAWALVALSILAGSATVSAHSYFVQSDPPDGSILERAPAKVVLAFSSAVAANFTSIQLVEAGGTRYVPTSVKPYPGVPSIVVVSLPPIPNGSYRLSFETSDAVDFHQTAGSIVFGVGQAPAAAGAVPTPAPPRASEFLLRWLALAGLSAILGGLVVAFLVVCRLPLETEVRARVQRWLLGLSLIGGGLVVAGETALFALQASTFGPVLPSMGRLLTGSEYGTRWLVTVLVVAGLTPLLAVLWRRAKRAEVRGLPEEFRSLGAWALLTSQVRVLVLGVALAVAMAFSGHVAGASGTSIGGIALLAAHVGAMGVWAGGVVALVVALVALRRASVKLEPKTVLALAVAFGPIAAVSFTVLAGTGLLLSGTQVASITALLSTQYGFVLMAKVALVGVVALIALRHALWTWRGLVPSALSRVRLPKRLPITIAFEAGGALAVVLLAAVLGASAPAQGPQFAPPDNGLSITQLTREQDGLLITVSVKPNRAGPNLVSVRLVNTRRPALAPVQRVTVLVMRPGNGAVDQDLATTRTGATYDAGSVRLDPGDVRFKVTVVRPYLADSVADVAWRVSALDVPRAPVVISDASLAPTANTAALLLLLVGAGAIGAGLLRHRRGIEAARSRGAKDSARSPRPRAGSAARHGRVPQSTSAVRRRQDLGLHLSRRSWLRRPARRP